MGPESSQSVPMAVLEVRRKEQERQQRIQRAMEYQDAAWVDEGADGEGSQEEEAAFVEDELCCVACDKFFKSANAMANHEKCARSHPCPVLKVCFLLLSIPYRVHF